MPVTTSPYIKRPMTLSKRLAWATVCLSCQLGSLAFAQERLTLSEELAPYQLTPAGVINRLRAINQGVRVRTLRLNVKEALTRSEASLLLQRARLALEGGEAHEVISDLRGELIREGLKGDPSYPLLLITLAKAEHQQGLYQSAEGHLAEALKVGAMARNRYEAALIMALDYTLIQPAQLAQRWSTYLALCKRGGRPPSPAVTYRVAKAHYLAGQLTASQRLLEPLLKGQTFKHRASFILGLIDLKRGAVKEAEERLSALDGLVQQARLNEARRRLSAEPETPYVLVSQGPITDSYGVSSGSLKVQCRPDPNADDQRCPASRPDRGAPDLVASELKALYGEALTDELQETIERVERELAEDQHNKTASRGGQRALPARELGPILDEVGAAVKISRARLALVEGRYEQAWSLYKGVPVGSGWADEALFEGVYLLSARGAYKQAARLLTQLLGQAGEMRSRDGTSTDLTLWLIELLYKSNELLLAQDEETYLKQKLKADQQAIEQVGESELYFDEVLSWFDDQEAQRLERSYIALEGLKIELMSSKALYNELARYLSKSEYPSTQEALEFVKQRRRALDSILSKLSTLTEPWERWSREREAPILGLPSVEISTSRVKESVARLSGRLGQLELLSESRRKGIKRSLPTWLAQIRQSVTQQQKKLTQLSAQLAQLNALMKREALRRVKAAQARLILSPTESTFWAKERASDDLSQMFSSLKRELQPLKDLYAQGQSSQTAISTLEVLAPYVRPPSQSPRLPADIESAQAVEPADELPVERELGEEPPPTDPQTGEGSSLEQEDTPLEREEELELLE